MLDCVVLTPNGAYPFGSRRSQKPFAGRVNCVNVESQTSAVPWAKFAA
jgi:hypothetical protein